MELDSDYWNALDKAKEMRIDPNKIGISHGIGDVGEGLKANVFRGAKIVELGFNTRLLHRWTEVGVQLGFRRHRVARMGYRYIKNLTEFWSFNKFLFQR